MGSVQFSRSVVSNSLRLHESQHARHPCPSPTPGVHSDSPPLSPWCHPAISSSLVPFSSCPQSLPASGSFPMSQLFTWGGQSLGASASVHPVNIQGWFSLGLVLSPCCSRVISSTTAWKHQFFSAHPSLWPNSHLYMTTGKTISLTTQTFVSKMMSLLFNMLSIFVIVFLPRSKHFLISMLQSSSAMILEPKKIKSVTVSIFSIYLPCSDGTGCHDLHFLNSEF